MTLDELRAALDDALAQARREIPGAPDTEALDGVARSLTGKRSAAAAAKEAIKGLTADERPEAGQALGAYNATVAELVDARRAELAASAVLEGDIVDLTLGSHGQRRGHLHLITQVQRELEDIFTGLGYHVAEGPEVEDDWHNFEALNIPPAHPARSMQDTLYVALGDEEQVMLRTHTSPVQIRTMETQAPPIYVVAPGRTFRNETLDARHSPVFHQMEGLTVDEGVTFADLKGTLAAFSRLLFTPDTKIRFGPTFFPFVEPGVDVAVSCVFCKGLGTANGATCRPCSGSGWIEIMGAGMVHPKVLRNGGIDPEKYSGFAFGMGIDRIAFLVYGVPDLRLFFENDLRFLDRVWS